MKVDDKTLIFDHHFTDIEKFTIQIRVYKIPTGISTYDLSVTMHPMQYTSVLCLTSYIEEK